MLTQGFTTGSVLAGRPSESPAPRDPLFPARPCHPAPTGRQSPALCAQPSHATAGCRVGAASRSAARAGGGQRLPQPAGDIARWLGVAGGERDGFPQTRSAVACRQRCATNLTHEVARPDPESVLWSLSSPLSGRARGRRPSPFRAARTRPTTGAGHQGASGGTAFRPTLLGGWCSWLFRGTDAGRDARDRRCCGRTRHTAQHLGFVCAPRAFVTRDMEGQPSPRNVGGDSSSTHVPGGLTKDRGRGARRRMRRASTPWSWIAQPVRPQLRVTEAHPAGQGGARTGPLREAPDGWRDQDRSGTVVRRRCDADGLRTPLRRTVSRSALGSAARTSPPVSSTTPGQQSSGACFSGGGPGAGSAV